MNQMGISQEDIYYSSVIIEKKDGNKIVIENPSVTKIKVSGQESFQVTGEIMEENSAPSISEEDIKTITEKTSATKEKARKTLEKTGDLAETILELSK